MVRNATKPGKLPLRPARMSARRLTALAVGVGLLVMALLLVRTLAQTHLRRTATNNLTSVTALTIAPGASSCQRETIVPRDTGSVTFPASSPGPGPARVELTAAGSTGTIAVPAAKTYLFMRLSPVVPADRRAVQVCFRNTGAAPLVLYGAPLAPGGPVHARLDWFRPAAQRNWTLGPTVASRFPLQKAPFLGPWAFWAAAVLVLGLSLAALLWFTRAVPE